MKLNHMVTSFSDILPPYVLGTITCEPQSTQPSSNAISPLFKQNGIKQACFGHPCMVNYHTFDMTGSRLVQFWICDIVTGASWRPLTKQTLSAGDGVLENGLVMAGSSLALP